MKGYPSAVRTMLAKLLLLIAVLLMPLGMVPAEATPHRGHVATMPMHCPEQGSKHQSRGAFAECTMACASALPAADRVQDQPIPRDMPIVAATPVRALNGLHPDPATPPPKSA